VASSSAIDRLARSVKRGGTPAWLPRAPQMTLHQGWLDRVDLFKGIVDFQFNDPSGLLLPAVRYVQAYSAENPPQVGDVVWAQHYGTDFMILGRHVVPDDVVIP
jgi:hypothetical protein